MPIDEFGGAGDPGPVAFRRIEIARLEQLAEEPLDVEPGAVEQFGGRGDDRFGRLGGGEEPEQLPRQEVQGRRLLHQDVDDVAAVEPARLAQEVLAAGVVVVGLEDELGAVAVPAGEGAGGLLHVGLGVVADPAGEQLHQLAGEVLVRVLLGARLTVEPDDHRRVAGDGQGQFADVAPGMAADRLDLLVHQAGAVHFFVAGGEVAVPEERELLAERSPGGHHPVDPPRLLGLDLAEVHEPAVDRLEGLLIGVFLVRGLVEEVFHGRFHPLRHGPVDRRGRGAKARPPQQMRGLAPVEWVGRTGNQRSEQVRGHGRAISPEATTTANPHSHPSQCTARRCRIEQRSSQELGADLVRHFRRGAGALSRPAAMKYGAGNCTEGLVPGDGDGQSRDVAQVDRDHGGHEGPRVAPWPRGSPGAGTRSSAAADRPRRSFSCGRSRARRTSSTSSM